MTASVFNIDCMCSLTLAERSNGEIAVLIQLLLRREGLLITEGTCVSCAVCG